MYQSESGKSGVQIVLLSLTSLCINMVHGSVSVTQRMKPGQGVRKSQDIGTNVNLV